MRESQVKAGRHRFHGRGQMTVYSQPRYVVDSDHRCFRVTQILMGFAVLGDDDCERIPKPSPWITFASSEGETLSRSSVRFLEDMTDVELLELLQPLRRFHQFTKRHLA
jgi:hypothetical protein